MAEIKFYSDLSLQGGAFINGARIENVAEAPASGLTGQLIFDQSDSLLKFWTGTEWASIQNDADLEAAIEALESAMSSVQGDITSLDGRVDTLETNMSSAQGDITSLDGRLDTAESNISSLNGDVAAHDGRLDTVESDISSLQADVVSLDGRVDTLETDMSSAQGDITSLDGRLDTAEGELVSLDGRLDTAESNISSLQGDVTSLDGRLDTAESNISSLQGDVTSLDGRVDTLETNMSSVQGDITSLDGRLDTAETNISSLQGDVTSLDGRVDTLETDMSSVQGDITSLDGRLDAIETAPYASEGFVADAVNAHNDDLNAHPRGIKWFTPTQLINGPITDTVASQSGVSLTTAGTVVASLSAADPLAWLEFEGEITVAGTGSVTLDVEIQDSLSGTVGLGQLTVNRGEAAFFEYMIQAPSTGAAKDYDLVFKTVAGTETADFGAIAIDAFGSDPFVVKSELDAVDARVTAIETAPYVVNHDFTITGDAIETAFASAAIAGNVYPAVSVWEDATGDLVLVDVARAYSAGPDTTTITVTFNEAPADGATYTVAMKI